MTVMRRKAGTKRGIRIKYECPWKCQEYLEIVKNIMKTNIDLNFSLDVQDGDLRTLVLSIRDMVDQVGK